MKYKLVVILLFFQIKFAFSQFKYPASSIKKYLNKLNIRLEFPEDYYVSDSGTQFICNDMRLTPVQMIYLIKKDSSMEISINLQVIADSAEIDLIKRDYNSRFVADSNYSNNVRAYSTSADFLPINYSKKLARKNFNADHLVIYERNCDMLKKFSHNKIMSISKDGRGYVQLVYLYNSEKIENDIMQIMFNTAKMIWFN